MRRILCLLAALLLCASLASAQVPMTGAGLGKPASGAAYQGPGDLGFGTVTAWFGFRCYTAAYSGNVADIFDAATGSTTETLITCDGHGNLVVTSPTAIATTCAAGCVVKTLYDQPAGGNCSGTCDAVQATNANRPTFLYRSASCGTNANLSCMQCPTSPAAAPLLSAAALSSTAQTFYGSLVFNAAAGTSQNYAGTGTAFGIAHSTGSANKVSFYSTSSVTGQTANDGAWHAIQTTAAGASSIMDIDSTVVTGLSAGVVAANGKFVLCSSTTATASMNAGYIAEFGLWPSTSTFSNTTMTSNQQNFYGGL